MDYVPELDQFTLWLTQYGNFALFGLLALGIIALPVPEETLMVIAGILMSHGKLEIPPTFIAAFGGSVVGITVSYLLGRTIGIFFLHKYGKWVGIKEKHIKQVHEWFEKYGKWTLLVGYFIPGVRHLTGFCAGTSYLEFKYFALFGYFGALFWVSTFLSIGYFFGHHWLAIYESLEIKIDDMVLVVIALFIVGLALYIMNKMKKA